MSSLDFVILAPSLLWIALALMWQFSGEPIRGLLCLVLFYLTLIFWNTHRILMRGEVGKSDVK